MHYWKLKIYISARTMEKLAPEIWKDNLWYFSTDVWSFALSAIKLFNRGAKLFPCMFFTFLK